MKIIATKAPRHQGFIFNKTLCVTLCLCVLVANFIAASHDAATSPGNGALKNILICVINLTMINKHEACMNINGE
jgi:uncharacterized membrane protein YphA (DoxX/SURF4 family)